jgi:hypothetical protein
VEERTSFNTAVLHQEAAGLKLFLDILNGPDNPTAEAELRYCREACRDTHTIIG